MSGLNSPISWKMRARSRTSARRPFDHRARLFGCERFQDRVQCRLGVLDDQHTRGAESDDAVADLPADRATAPGHDDGLALHEIAPADGSRSSRSAAAASPRRSPELVAAPRHPHQARQAARREAQAAVAFITTVSGVTVGSSADGVSTMRPMRPATQRRNQRPPTRDRRGCLRRKRRAPTGPGPPATATKSPPARSS